MPHSLPLQETALRTVPDLLERALEFGPQRLFFRDVETGRELTYGALLEHISSLAQELSRRFPPGAVITTLLSNRPECVVLRYALSCAALVEAPINGEHKGPVLKGMLDVAAPAAIVGDRRYLANLETCGYGFERCAWIDETALQELCARRAPWDARPRVEVGPDAPCRTVFTSGTTSVSKGAELSHGYEVYTGYAYASRTRLGPNDRCLYVTPFFHIDSMLTLSTLLHTGGAFLLAPRFSASRFWQDATRAGATAFLYVGTILSILRKLGDPPAGHGVRMGFGVGSTPKLAKWFEDRHRITLLEAYGLTECAAVAIDDAHDRRRGSCGRALEGYEVEVLDEHDRILPPGRRGEIAIRPLEPFALFTGYRGNPQATLESFRNLWFHTGDLGSFDAERCLAFHGRLKDVIRHRDENISAEELEAVVDTHPAVMISAAVPVPSELGDEDVLLYVQPREHAHLEPEDLCSYLAARVAPFMVPRHIRVMERLPLTPTEKVAKSRLARQPDSATWTRP
jgi:crotonobetaine/carnitine-CoA ligase